MKRLSLFVLLLVAGGMLGCNGNGYGLFGDNKPFVKPTIAVMKFQNRAPFPLNWNLSGGMRDILVDRLVATDRYQVIERPEIDSVLRELNFQHSGATRKYNRAEPGRLKNVQYLIKGTVTDFGHVQSQSGFFNLLHWDIFGGGNRAVMGLTMYVVDVESGEIICSESIEQSVRADDLSVKTAYKDVAFGGSVFYRTPLGRATSKVIDKAVKEITSTIAARPWTPKIAMVQDKHTVIINGGTNRDVEAGDKYEVYELGEPIIDPDTGDVIGRQPGSTVARITVIRVCSRYSIADVDSGKTNNLRTGQRCREITQLAGGKKSP